jgi:hypothetical protein
LIQQIPGVRRRLDVIIQIDISAQGAEATSAGRFQSRLKEDIDKIKHNYPDVRVKSQHMSPDGAKGEAELIHLIIDNIDQIKDGAMILYYTVRSATVLFGTLFGKKEEKKEDKNEPELIPTKQPKIKIKYGKVEIEIPATEAEIEDLKKRALK